MKPVVEFGIEEVTAEDRAYRGSRFREVRNAIFANPYQNIWGAAGEPPLPCRRVTLPDVLRGLLPFARRYAFWQASGRTVDSHADLRWGPDRKGFRRIVNSNGVCLTGLWDITEETPYSGYFRQGSRALTVARYSTCCSETRRGHRRSLALAGKLYPTADPDHNQPLRTASVFTHDDIGGGKAEFVNDAVLLNAPDVTFWRRGKGLPVLLVEGLVFTLVDKVATMRQVYEIAELGKPAGEPTRAPDFLRLLVRADQPRIEGAELDFRDEIMGQIYDKGDPAPKRKLTFDIEVTDEGRTYGFQGLVRRTFKNWRRIGSLTFDEAVVSYNGDFVIHFHHPGWRADRNDPKTAHRRSLY